MTRYEDDFTTDLLNTPKDPQLAELEKLLSARPCGQPKPLSDEITVQHRRAPAGLSREDAAHYVGVSSCAFDGLVERGLMPKPLDLGIRRNVWNVRALDAALDRLAGLSEDIASLSPVSSDNQLLKRLHAQG